MIETRPIRRAISRSNPWLATHKGDLAALALAERHYTRQTPGARAWARNGQNLVLILGDESAVWCLHRPKPGKATRTDGRDAWECTIFRNEGWILSSHLIRLALDACLKLASGGAGRPGIEDWGPVPPDGIITYVMPSKVRSVNPGCCFKKAGWVRAGAAWDGKPMYRAPLPPGAISLDC